MICHWKQKSWIFIEAWRWKFYEISLYFNIKLIHPVSYYSQIFLINSNLVFLYECLITCRENVLRYDLIISKMNISILTFQDYSFSYVNTNHVLLHNRNFISTQLEYFLSPITHHVTKAAFVINHSQYPGNMSRIWNFEPD